MQIRLGPAGVHFFDRRTGLNFLAEGPDLSPASWSLAPRNVSVALTNACDLHCPYCYAPKESAAVEAGELVAWIDELDANGCLGIGFGGGEPTLHRDLAFLCEYVTRQTGMAASLTTHGHFLDSRRTHALEGNVHFIRLSMDGVGSTYEALRGRSFASFLACAEVAASIAPIGLNFVVNAATVVDLDRAVLVASRLGACQFLLLPERPVANRPGIDSATMQKLHQWVNEYSGDVPLGVSDTSAGGFPTCDPLAVETGLRAYAHIDAHGNIKNSSYDQHGIPVGEDGVLVAISRLNGRHHQK